MPIKKTSKSGKSIKERECQQRERQEQGEIPPVPKSPDDRPLTLESEGACGQSSIAEDSEHLEELQCHDSEEADLADSKQASGRKISWREKRKFIKEKKKQDKRDKERKGRNQEEQQQKQESPEAQGDQPASDDGTTCNEEKDFQSAAETSFWKEEEPTLSDVERMILLQRASTAEEGAKQAETHLQRLSKEKVALQDKLETMNKQFQKLEQWHKLTIDDAKQTSEATPDVPQEETVVVNREKHKQLKSSFILLTEKNMKIEADKAELTIKYAAQEHTCEHLKQENLHLVQKLQKLEGEHNRLMAVYGTVTQQLSQLHKCMGEVDAMKKQAAAISEAMTTKTVEAMNLKDEKDSLQTMLHEIAEELERQKIQAETYKEDFENERKDREARASAYEEEKAAVHVQHQQIVDDLKLQTEEKAAHLGKALAHKSDLEDQLQQSKTNHEHKVNQLQDQLQQLQSESTELRQQIARANEEIAAWRGDCQAKTQQVKQYSKQVEQFRIQVDGLTAELRDKRAKIAEIEQQLEYYQEQVRQLNEDEEQKVAMMKAQFESEMLNMNRDLERLRREKVMWEMMTKQGGDQRGTASTCDEQAIAHVQSLNQQLDSLKQANHALDIELQSERSKFLQVSEKCEVYWEQIDILKKLLKANNISVPKLELPSALTGRYPGVHPSGQHNVPPGAAVPHSPHTPHMPRQMGQGGEYLVHSLPQHTTSRDGPPDKSMTSPAVIALGQQPFKFNPQHQRQDQLIMPSGGMQQREQQHQHGYAGQGGMMVAPGQQDQCQQMQHSPQAWQGGQQGGGATPELRASRAKIAEYEQQLEYYQEQARQLDQKVALLTCTTSPSPKKLFPNYYFNNIIVVCAVKKF